MKVGKSERNSLLDLVMQLNKKLNELVRKEASRGKEVDLPWKMEGEPKVEISSRL